MEVDVGTWASTLAIIGAIVALYLTLRRELRAEIGDVSSELRGELGELKAHVVRLDDRVYALAVGMKPVIDEAAARSPKG